MSLQSRQSTLHSISSYKTSHITLNSVTLSITSTFSKLASVATNPVVTVVLNEALTGSVVYGASSALGYHTEGILIALFGVGFSVVWKLSDDEPQLTLDIKVGRRLLDITESQQCSMRRECVVKAGNYEFRVSSGEALKEELKELEDLLEKCRKARRDY